MELRCIKELSRFQQTHIRHGLKLKMEKDITVSIANEISLFQPKNWVFVNQNREGRTGRERPVLDSWFRLLMSGHHVVVCS